MCQNRRTHKMVAFNLVSQYTKVKVKRVPSSKKPCVPGVGVALGLLCQSFGWEGMDSAKAFLRFQDSPNDLHASNCRMLFDLICVLQICGGLATSERQPRIMTVVTEVRTWGIWPTTMMASTSFQATCQASLWPWRMCQMWVPRCV